jgi:D-amino-acid dehydrogenase
MELGAGTLGVNPPRIRGIVRSMGRYLPAFTPERFAGVEPWSGLRPCTPDGLPYIGRSARRDNLLVATGHAMLGLSLGPVTGSLIASIVSGEQPAIDLEPLRPERFG